MNPFAALGFAVATLCPTNHGCLAPVVSLTPTEHGKVDTYFVQDRWTGADKVRHFWMSFATTAFAFAAATSADLDRDAALTVAVSTGALAGLGKEVIDVRSGRVFSVRDLVADALGVAAAYFLLREVR